MVMAKGLTGRHVLLMMIGFFGVTLGVNAYMVKSALTTFSGEVVPQSYAHGLKYNETLAARQAQRAAGWQAKIAADRGAQDKVTVTLLITDRAGAPVRGLDLRATMRLPATEREDKNFTLAETAPGRYAAQVAGVRSAMWEITVIEPGATPDAPRFEARNRLWLR
jgi:nitrogen fixation protein FixH